MPKLDALKWYHLFNSWVVCPKVELGVIAKVLLQGPWPNPDPNCATRKNEAALGIEPAQVYAYLGRLHEAFGTFALMLSPKGLSGKMSPFDTGGLVAKIKPICELKTNDEKREYCQSFTWDTQERPECLAKYPGDRVEQYITVDNSRPDCEGPHCKFPGKTAEIWTAVNEDPRSWTWEGRTPEGFDAGELIAWTAPTSFWDRFKKYLRDVPAADRHLYRDLMRKYEKDGIKALIERQAAELRAA